MTNQNQLLWSKVVSYSHLRLKQKCIPVTFRCFFFKEIKILITKMQKTVLEVQLSFVGDSLKSLRSPMTGKSQKVQDSSLTTLGAVMVIQ